MGWNLCHWLKLREIASFEEIVKAKILELAIDLSGIWKAVDVPEGELVFQDHSVCFSYTGWGMHMMRIALIIIQVCCY